MHANGMVTEDNQKDPDGGSREYFNGVLDEAIRQGYSRHATGRIFVLALRAWERR